MSELYCVSENESKLWRDDLSRIKNFSTGVAIEESSKIASKWLPNISSMKDEINFGAGFVQISGVPIDSTIPSPPSNGKRPDDKGTISELSLLGITHALGFNPFSYLEEKEGVLVHEISPASDSEDSHSSLGKVAFEFHTDGAYLDRHLRPHTLSLLCLVNDAQTGTQLASLENALKLLSADDIKILMNDEYQHTAPETFNVEESTKHASVLDRIDGVFEIKAALHSTKGLTVRAEQALDALRQALYSVAVTKHWNPGDLVIFNNLRCMHGRGDIRGQRWLQRCYGSQSVIVGSVVQLNN